MWNVKPTLDILNQLVPNTMLEALGIAFTEVGENFLEATMPVDKRTKQPMGLLHGGASVALAESLGSVAAYLSSPDPLKATAVGVEINANHIKPATKGIVTGRVTPIKVGKTIQVWQIYIKDQDENLICSSRLTTMSIQNKKG